MATTSDTVDDHMETKPTQVDHTTEHTITIHNTPTTDTDANTNSKSHFRKHHTRKPSHSTMPMAFFYSYPEIEPYPTTYVAHTYPEKGHHLHHIPMGYLAHKAHTIFHDRDREVHLPKADIRETSQNYYIEIELPGIKEKSQLHLRWTTMRTLLLTSFIARPEIPESELEDDSPASATEEPPSQHEQQTPPQKNGTASDMEGADLAPSLSAATKTTATSQSPPKKEAHLTLHERLVGELMRAFNFPVDVDRDNTHAKLDAGLLRVVVPKLVVEQAEHAHLPVMIHDAMSNGSSS